MKLARLHLALLLPLAACATSATERTAAGDAALEQELAGLVVGRTSNCLPPFRPTQSQVYGDAIVYSLGSGVKYVSRTGGGCRSGQDDILVTRTVQAQVCRGDIAVTLDRSINLQTGSCTFGAFTEYRRP